MNKVNNNNKPPFGFIFEIINFLVRFDNRELEHDVNQVKDMSDQQKIVVNTYYCNNKMINEFVVAVAMSLKYWYTNDKSIDNK